MTAFDLAPALRSRQNQGLYRFRRTLSSAQKPEVWIDGHRYLAFCSNNYLGLADHPDVVSAFKKAANKYGVGGGASHLVVGHSEPHRLLEEELAEFTGRDRTLLYANGYMANLGVISALLGKKDGVFLDRLNHASLVDAALLSAASFQRYRHCYCQNLEEKLQKSSAYRKLIVTDGVFSMDGDIAPLDKLPAITKQYDAWLMVDDAHGFGVLGENGGGVAEHFNLSQQELPVLMGTLGKAFGCYGAFVAGSNELIETMIQFSRPYIYTTSIPPAVTEASRASLKLVKSEYWRRDHLKKLISYFRQHCQASGIELTASSTPIQPLVVGSASVATAISNTLASKNILITAIRPPTVPTGTSRLRIALSASHTFEHIDYLLEILGKIAGRHAMKGT
ncbi:MAG: 8-amino-7-oxononanoate synthase [Candidatus Endonucleobacter bathymodioli]|uniref:8-amino-7-oxononanoate synthase n=1 Tax=Candidatus Endonucleibacter bathymodioli TaxID=539814 RepID=A0AA90P1J5_9GAMM|nr:8-amino-7-oxononanoate synthase [Candidatus Endonucleobacter bathymodioli]